MKEIFKKAHAMTREIKREYPEVDYRTQFGICLSYLLNNKEEEKEMKEMKFYKKEEVEYFENGMLVLTTSRRQRAWVAEITGTDKRYRFARQFINKPTINEGRCVYYELDEGKIYNWHEGRRQYFGIVENGKLYEITERDVENLIAK